MFDKYKNPNKKGIAQAVDMAGYAGKTMLDKMLGGKTTSQSLGAEVDKALSPTKPTEYQEHAESMANKLMKQNGMTEKAGTAEVPPLPTDTIPSAEQLNAQFELPAVEPRNQQGPQGPNNPPAGNK